MCMVRTEISKALPSATERGAMAVYMKVANANGLGDRLKKKAILDTPGGCRLWLMTSLLTNLKVGEDVNLPGVNDNWEYFYNS